MSTDADTPFTIINSPGAIYEPYGSYWIYSLANKPEEFQAVPAQANDPPVPLDVTRFPDAYRKFCDQCQFPAQR